MTLNPNKAILFNQKLHTVKKTLVPFLPHLRLWVKATNKLNSKEFCLVEHLLSTNFFADEVTNGSFLDKMADVSRLNKHLIILWPQYQKWVYERFAYSLVLLVGFPDFEKKINVPISELQISISAKKVLHKLETVSLVDFFGNNWQSEQEFEKLQVAFAGMLTLTEITKPIVKFKTTKNINTYEGR